jgi:lysyl-tRNA synthetase class I
MSDFETTPTEWTPYDVTCARCGKVLSCTEAVVEEGDEWECVPCWERCEAKEKAAMKGE